MKIKFKKVILNNFLSFKKAEVDLNDRGYTLISGINENPDDLAKSNGSGKSSLLESINWCLTGETIRGSSDVKRIGSESECSVRLLFTCDGNEYDLTRTKDPSNLILIVNGEDKSGKGIRDTSKILSEYLPDITPSLLGSVIILGQGLPQRFTNNTPSGRKEVLEKLSKSDFMIEDLKKRILDRKSTLNENKRTLEDNNLKLTTEKELRRNQLQDITNKLNTLVKPDTKTIEINKNRIQELSLESDSLLVEINKYNESIKSIRESLLDISNNLSNTLLDIESHKSEELSAIEIEEKEVYANITSLTQEIRRLKNITDVCPTCGQKIPGVLKPDTSSQENKLEELNNKHSTLNENIKSIKAKFESHKLSAQEESNNKSNSLKSDERDLNNKLIELNNNLSKINKEKEELSILNSKLFEEISTYDTIKNGYEYDIASIESSIKDIEDKLLYNNNELEILNSHFEVINKMSNLITRDFRGYLLTNIINFINKKAKEYSKDIFETDKIEFVLDGNNIDISYDSKSYENLSGGEKQKVDIIIQLSIRDMLCKYLNFSSNILVLDEISDNIDSVGAERLFTLISNKLNDLETIFIISHHIDFQIPTDDEIIVKKGEDKISRIM